MDKKMLYAIVAVVVVVIIVGAVAAVYLLAPPPGPAKYQLELWYNNDGHYGDTEDELATVLKNSIEACGKVQVTLRSDTWAVYRQNWVAGTMPVFLLGWYPDYFDSDDYISPFLSTSGATSLGSFYSNATMDTWITEEQSTTDPAIRDGLFSSIQAKLAEDVPYLPLFSGTAEVAYVTGIQNVELHPVTFKWFIMDKPAANALTASTTDDVTSFDPAYTYHLRPNIKFHDGTAFNASVMKRSIDRAIRLDIGGSAAFLLYDVGALGRNATYGNNTSPGVIEVVDDLTIRFNLARPVSFFNDLMAFSVAAPVPWAYNPNGEQPSVAGQVIGTGPYNLTAYTPDQLVVLTKFGTYHNPGLYSSFGIPAIPVEDTVTINLRGSAAALKTDIETQAVDVVYRTLTPTDLADLQARAGTLGITVDVGQSPQIRYLVFNTETITDARVRQAIAYSVDRAQIDSVVFNGLVTPLYSMIPSNMPYHEPIFQTEYGDADCTSANALFAQLGFVVGLFEPREFVARDH